MIGWNPGYNWTYDQFKRVVSNAFDVEGNETVSLDVEHSDWRNIEDIMRWATEMGYTAREVNCDVIRVTR